MINFIIAYNIMKKIAHNMGFLKKYESFKTKTTTFKIILILDELKKIQNQFM